ncbi:carboxypeptidase-like regulatory domain-containing protein [uncultured Lacinutrix sp.]|uniref:carboxypeptidase-like regulatory domain-containing protein n=1 Tax=uncultured Lacinutrix sp. TaxID=574032 RepID=UPI00261A76F6|nr:carboxypeptidase-like regulatory domain-containing protein [uncultured Lacinutrix sp.]
MKQLLFFTMLFVSVFCVNSQNVESIEVSGEIIVSADDLDNVTIYNESSNKGAVTDSIGRFKIKVALNDELQISAIQFKSFKTKVTQNVIDSKFLRIYLKEQVNTLDEVVLLQYDLTGNLEVDVANAKVNKPVLMPNLGDVSAIELPDDHHSGVDNIAIGSQNDRIRYQANGMAIIGLLVDAIFKTKNKKNKKRQNKKNKIGVKFEVPISRLATVFKNEYYIENYNIPEQKVNEFIVYLEESNFDYALLEPSKEIELIEYLHNKSQVFLNEKSEKN